MKKDNMEFMIEKLYETILRVQDKEGLKILFQDLLTFTELEQISQRIMASKLLMKDYTYAEIIKLTGISSTTLSRVSRCISHGSGGYKKFVKLED